MINGSQSLWLQELEGIAPEDPHGKSKVIEGLNAHSTDLADITDRVVELILKFKLVSGKEKEVVPQLREYLGAVKTYPFLFDVQDIKTNIKLAQRLNSFDEGDCRDAVCTALAALEPEKRDPFLELAASTDVHFPDKDERETVLSLLSALTHLFNSDDVYFEVFEKLISQNRDNHFEKTLEFISSLEEAILPQVQSMFKEASPQRLALRVFATMDVEQRGSFFDFLNTFASKLNSSDLVRIFKVFARLPSDERVSLIEEIRPLLANISYQSVVVSILEAMTQGLSAERSDIDEKEAKEAGEGAFHSDADKRKQVFEALTFLKIPQMQQDYSRGYIVQIFSKLSFVTGENPVEFAELCHRLSEGVKDEYWSELVEICSKINIEHRESFVNNLCLLNEKVKEKSGFGRLLIAEALSCVPYSKKDEYVEFVKSNLLPAQSDVELGERMSTLSLAATTDQGRSDFIKIMVQSGLKQSALSLKKCLTYGSTNEERERDITSCQKSKEELGLELPKDVKNFNALYLWASPANRQLLLNNLRPFKNQKQQLEIVLETLCNFCLEAAVKGQRSIAVARANKISTLPNFTFIVDLKIPEVNRNRLLMLLTEHSFPEQNAILANFQEMKVGKEIIANTIDLLSILPPDSRVLLSDTIAASLAARINFFDISKVIWSDGGGFQLCLNYIRERMEQKPYDKAAMAMFENTLRSYGGGFICRDFYFRDSLQKLGEGNSAENGLIIDPAIKLHEEIKLLTPFPHIDLPACYEGVFSAEEGEVDLTFNLEEFQKGRVEYTFAEIPDLGYAEVEAMANEMCLRLKSSADLPQIEQYIAQNFYGKSVEELKVEMKCDARSGIVDKLKDKLVSEQGWILARLLKSHGLPDEPVPTAVFCLRVICQDIKSEKNKAPHDGLLQSWEEKFLKFLSQVDKCPTGQEEAIELFYSNLPKESQFQMDGKAEALLINGPMRIKSYLQKSIPQVIRDTLKSEGLLKELKRQSDAGRQQSHESRYLSNVYSLWLGLNDPYVFDEHGGGYSTELRRRNPLIVLNTILSHAVERLNGNINRAINNPEVREGIKYLDVLECFDTLHNNIEQDNKKRESYLGQYIQVDEDSNDVQLTQAGMLTLLRQADFIRI